MIAQFSFCGQLEIRLGKVKVAILQKNDIQKAIDVIQEMEELITHRKQKIQIADSSKTGWITIQHLEKGEKTSLSPEDRKRVAAADEAAEKEIENRKKQKRTATERRNQDGDKTFSTNRDLFRGNETLH